MKLALIFIVLFIGHFSIAQRTIKLTSVLEPRNFSIGNDSVQINQFKFYLTDIKLFNHHKEIWQEKNSYHLIDLSQEDAFSFILNIPEPLSFDEIEFNIGVDSTTNMKGVQGLDLDPMLGMYWSWQSGYINLKLEGFVNEDPFTYHLGGFKFPYNTLQKIRLSTLPTDEMIINVNPKPFFINIDLEKNTHVMSPGKQAHNLSSLLSLLFSIPH